MAMLKIGEDSKCEGRNTDSQLSSSHTSGIRLYQDQGKLRYSVISSEGYRDHGRSGYTG